MPEKELGDTHTRLHWYIDDIVSARLDTLYAILSERAKQLDLTAGGLEKRLDHLNQLREEYIRKENQFVLKEVYDAAHENLRLRLEKAELALTRLVDMPPKLELSNNRISNVESKQATQRGIAIGISLVSGLFGAIVGAVIAHVFK